MHFRLSCSLAYLKARTRGRHVPRKFLNSPKIGDKITLNLKLCPPVRKSSSSNINVSSNLGSAYPGEYWLNTSPAGSHGGHVCDAPVLVRLVDFLTSVISDIVLRERGCLAGMNNIIKIYIGEPATCWGRSNVLNEADLYL